MADIRPFSPQFGSTQAGTLAALGTVAKNLNADSTTIRVLNTGAGDLYVRAYDSKGVAAVASATDYRVLPNVPAIIYIGDVMDRVSFFSVAGTTFEVMTGDGGV